jgi:hypothetical protein
MVGQQVCMMHGGKSRRGLSHPNIKDGRHADPRYLGILRQHDPEGAARFKELAADRARLSLEPEITALDLRAEGIYRQIVSGEYRSCTELLGLAEAIIEAEMAKDREKKIEGWKNLLSALRDGRAQEKGWEQFDRLAWQRKPRLLEAEAKRKVLQQEMYQRKVVIELLQAVAASIKRNVKDKDDADAIYRDILRLTEGDAGAGLAPGRASQTGH